MFCLKYCLNKELVIPGTATDDLYDSYLNSMLCRLSLKIIENICFCSVFTAQILHFLLN